MRGFFQRFGWILLLIIILVIVGGSIFLILNKSYNSMSEQNLKETNNENSETELLTKTDPEKELSAGVETVDEITDLEKELSVGVEKVNEIVDDEGVPSIIDNNANITKDTEIDIMKRLDIIQLEEQAHADNNSLLAEIDKNHLKDISNKDINTSELKASKSKSIKLKESDDSKKQKKQTISDLNIDIMRVDNEGDTLVAGTAAPNVTVEILVDEKLIATTKSDSSGNFVAMGLVKNGNQSQTMTVRSQVGQDTVIKNGTAENNNLTTEREWTISDSVFVLLPSNFSQKQQLNVKSDAAPIIVQSNSEDIKIIQKKDISPVNEVTIDSISYSDLGEAVLVGRAKPNFKILIYLDNKLTSSTLVGASGGWTTELTGILPGIYNLRLDEVDSIGVVLSRIETPFKKEAQDILMNMVSGSITVQTGNSLWRIARRIFGKGIKYIEIYQKNSDFIIDPNLIYPGQVFSIPSNN